MALIRIRYKGLSDIREMSKKDLAGAGVNVDGKLLFDASNRHTVFVQDPSDRLLELLREEGTFQVEEVDEESGKDVKTIIKGAPLDDTGSVVKDGVTGEVSVAPSGAGTATGRTGKGRSTAGD